MRPRVKRGIVLLFGGILVLAASFFVVSGLGGGRATAGTTCTVSASGAATVTLGDGTTTLSLTSLSQLQYATTGAATSCSAVPVTTISVSVSSSVANPSAVLLVLDESNGNLFPCTAGAISGTLAGPGGVDGSLQVNGPPGSGTKPGSLFIGANGGDIGGCKADDETLTGTAATDLVGAANSSSSAQTLSAAGDGLIGGSDTGASTGPVTLDATKDATGQADLLYAGNGADTFVAGEAGTTLSFAGETNASCTASGSCQETVNATAAPVSGPGTTSVPADTAVLASSGGTVLQTDTLEQAGTTDPAGLTDFGTVTGPASSGTGNPNITVNYSAPPGTYTLGSYGSTFNETTATTSAYTLTFAAGGDSVYANGAGTAALTVTASNTTFHAGSGTDTFTVTGSQNDFIAANGGTGNFYDSGTGDTVDLTAISASPGNQLTVNDSGTGQGGLGNGQASLGSTTIVTFRNSSDPGNQSASDFIQINGAANGSTNLLASGNGGLEFQGAGQTNTATFYGNPGNPNGVVANLSSTVETTTAPLSSSLTLASPFQVSAGAVLVSNPGSGTSCYNTVTGALQTWCDAITDVTTVTGPTVGYSTFYAGDGAAYSFTDAGSNNTFYGGANSSALADTFSGGGNNNDYVAGSGPDIFQETGGTQGASNNTIDFSKVPTGTSCSSASPPCQLVINVSGNTIQNGTSQAVLFDNASNKLSTYTFSTGATAFTNFIGALSGSTTFQGGVNGTSYVGQGPGNTLDYSGVAPAVASTLKFDVTHTPNPQATLGALPETFSGITNLVGLNAGSTQFVGGSEGGYNFVGKGTGNKAVFSAQGPSTTLTVSVASNGSAATGGTVTFTSGATTLCSAVPVVSGEASCVTPPSTATGPVTATYTPTTGSPSSVQVTPLPSGKTPTATTLGGATTSTLTATVTATDGSTPTGSVTFTVTPVAGGSSSSCTQAVSASGTASCSPGTLATGQYQESAAYTPSGSYAPSQASNVVSLNGADAFTTTTLTDPTCTGSGGDCTINVTVKSVGPAIPTASSPATTPNLPNGTVQIYLPQYSEGSQVYPAIPFCTLSITGGTTSASASCSSVYDEGLQLVGVFTPANATVSGSSGSVTEPTFGSFVNTSSTVSATTNNPSLSQSDTFTSTVTSGGSAVSGGTVAFTIAGGNASSVTGTATTLCGNAPVSSTGTATCTVPRFVNEGSADIQAVYTPPPGSTALTFGSSADLPILVASPTTFTQTMAATSKSTYGVYANLSATSQSSTATGGVTVAPNQVLTAEQPAGVSCTSPSVCTGTSLPAFLDSLTDITSVQGSSGGTSTFVAGTPTGTGPLTEAFGDPGTVGGDTIDFRTLPTGSGAPLSVNTTGSATSSGLANDTAVLGTTTYDFTSGTDAAGYSDFTTFLGATNGNTTYLAGGSPSNSFTAYGATNAIDFSSVASGITVTPNKAPPALASPAVTPTCGDGTATTEGTVNLPNGGEDCIAGLTTVTGSTAGGNTFYGGSTAGDTYTAAGSGNVFHGGSQPDTFNATGGDNVFAAGTGSDTINGNEGAGDTLDFSALSGSLTVNASSGQIGQIAGDTAVSGGSKYTFTSLQTVGKTFNGSGGGTLFYASPVPDTFNGDATSTGPNELSYYNTSGNTLTFCVVAGVNGLSNVPGHACVPMAGNTFSPVAILGSIDEGFSNIQTFDGLPGGSTTFVAGDTGGYTFNGSGAGNTLDFSPASAGVKVDLTAGKATVKTGSDALTDVSTVIGSAAGSNSFKAASGTEVFSDPGTAGKDALDLSAVPTTAISPLSVNVSGSAVPAGANTVGNDTATTGAATYTFSSPVGSQDFTTFTGATSGYTAFYANGTTGYSFTGTGAGNSISFAADNLPLVANLSATTLVTTTGTSAVSTPAGVVTICTDAACDGTGAGTDQDQVAGITIVAGPNAGGSTLAAGSLPSQSYVFTANGNGNTLIGGGDADTFTATGNTQDFKVGTGGASITDTGSGNTVDLSGAGSPLSVNVSGTTVGASQPTNTAVGAATTTFSNVPTAFIGATGGNTTFYAGAIGDTFTGQGANNTLSFADITTNLPLTVCPVTTGTTCGTAGKVQATLGALVLPFSDIQSFYGLPNGNSTFAGGNAGGFSFQGVGSTNTLDLSAATAGVTVDLVHNTATVSGGTDYLAGISTVIGSQAGGNTFKAANGTETFTDSGTSGKDTVDLTGVSATAQSPLTVNVSGSYVSTPGGTVNNDNALTGASTYTFNSPVGSQDFTSFVGSGNGNTAFYANGGAGYSFAGTGAGNSISFAADSSPIVANLSSSALVTTVASTQVTTGTGLVTLCTSAACTSSGTDQVTGITTVAGPNAGGSTLAAGSLPTLTYAFTANGNGNTLIGGGDTDTFTAAGNSEDFKVGPAGATITDTGSGNTVDFSNVGSPLSVNVSGTTVGASQATNTAVGPSTTTFSNVPTTFIGASSGSTIFYAGGVGDTFTGKGTGNTLSFADITTNLPLTICPVTTGSTCASAGKVQAVLGSLPIPFTDIQSFYGLPNGNTTFAGGNTTGLSFEGAGSGNTLDLSAATAGVTVDLVHNTATASGGTDYLADIANVIGSTAGGNTFRAANSTETFSDPGSAGMDAIDFTGVSTTAQTPLLVNLTGQSVTSGSSTVGSDSAVAGGNQYTFTTGGPGFTTFTGSGNGNTSYFAAPSPGYTMNGSGSGNSVSFAAVPGSIQVNLQNSTGNVTFTGSAQTDTVTDMSNVIGPVSGSSTFTSSNQLGSTSTFTANGSGNTFVGGPGTNNFNAAGNNEDFQIYSGGATINDTGTGNTIDFTNAGPSLTLNVSGTASVNGVVNDTAVASGTTTFSNVPTTFVGTSSGSSLFFAGAVSDTFAGKGSGNILSFADVTTNSSLAFCVAAPTGSGCTTAGQAVLGSVHEPFSDIQTYDGLEPATVGGVGNTTFVAGPGPGEAFNGFGSGNVADLSAAPAGLAVDLSSTQAGNVTFPAAAGSDSITGATTVYGSSQGHNAFTAGTSAEVFGDRGTAGGDSIDFVHVPTSNGTPLVVNVSGTPTSSGLVNDAAAAGGLSYSFTTGGADFVSFYGAGTGFTRFDAPRTTVGYSFCATTSCAAATTSNDTLDLSANLTGVVADVSGNVADPGSNRVTYPAGSTTAPGGVGAYDVLGAPGSPSGFSAVIGSPSAQAANTFYGAGTGTAFSSSSNTNTLSYAQSPNRSLTFDLTKDTVTGTSSTPDSFSFPSSTPTIIGTGGGDTFRAGTTAASIQGDGGSDTLDLSATPAPASGTTGDTVDMSAGTVTGSTIGTLTFTPCNTASATSLCVSTIKGSAYADTYVAPPAASAVALTITGNGGTDSLNLSHVSTKATVTMPIGTSTGTVAASPYPAITFTGVPDITGTAPGGDTFVAGSGAESFTESGSAQGTLDLRAIGATNTTAGATVSVGVANGTPTGTATSSGLGVSDTFTGLDSFLGTPGTDTFTQTSDGSFNFDGEAGPNVLNLSGLSEQATIDLIGPTAECGAGATTNNGTAKDSQVNDTFECMAQVITSGQQLFTPASGEQVTLNGGGNGILDLMGDTGGQGLTITLPNGTSSGTVTGDGYNVTFTGMSTVDGSPYNDIFVPGSGNVTINGGGGIDTLRYRGAAAAADVNLSATAYTVPAGQTGAGTTLPPETASGGNGGTLTTQGITNVLGTTTYNDILVAGPGSGTLIGGAGNTRFVPTGGDDVINGGTGTGTTVDLSALSGKTTLNLAVGTPQQTGDGLLTIAPGTIHNLVASNAGSTLFAGNGKVNLYGGPGADYLAAGTGTQTLTSGGGADTLVAGSGTQTLNGGSSPVTFVPGAGSDTLVSTTTGNTLSYASATVGAQVNLSANLYTVPNGKPLAGTTLSPTTATGGNGATVNLSQAGITSVVGSPQADVIVSAGSGETINGGGGADLIVVNAGNNTLTAPTGSTATFLFNGAGSNTISGGGSSTVDFSQGTTGVNVNLQLGTASGGFAGSSESMTGVLNIIGTNFDDVLVAGPAGGTVTGLNGNDFLEAGPSGGDTLIGGGNGSDNFCAESVCAQSGTVAGGGDTMTGGTGNDTFYAQNGAVDTVNGEGGLNKGYFDANDVVTNVQTEL